MSAYTEHIASNQWQNLSKLCRDAASNQCQMCGGKHAVMHSHHMSYRNMRKPNEGADICVLCEDCHVAYHRNNKLLKLKDATRSMLLDDLSTCLAGQGVDVSHFHANRLKVNDEWNASIGLAPQPKRAKQSASREENPFVQITWEIIDLAKRGNGAYDNHALMLMGAELPRKDDWKKKLVGKFIKKELLQSIKALMSKPPINEIPKTKKERNAKWERENRHYFRDINDHNKRKQLAERKQYI
jgi:hypothetical protein